jgi:hypothetical protein
MDLFRAVAIPTEKRLGYPYPTDLDEHLSGYIQMLCRRANPVR